MLLAPRAGARGKDKARAVPGEGSSPGGGRSRFTGEPSAYEIPGVGAWEGAGAEVEALAGSGVAISAAAGGVVGGAGLKADVAMLLAPRAGDSGKEKARAVPGESSSPGGSGSRFSGEPSA